MNPFFQIGEIRLAIAIDSIELYFYSIGQYWFDCRRAEKRGEEDDVPGKQAQRSQAMIHRGSRLIKKVLAKMDLSPSRTSLLSKKA